MPLPVEVLLLVAVLLALLATGLWIPFALGTAAMLFPLLVGEPFNFDLLGDIAWNNTNSFVLTAVPLFVLMGELIVHSGISRRFYQALAPLARRVPGGLLHANVTMAGLLAAVTGSSVATAGAVGAAAIPEMKAQRYAPRLTYGSITGGGMLGILIPPSIIMIIYASLAEQSVADLFLAGVIPGLLLVSLFLLYIAIRVKINPSLAPPAQPRGDSTETPSAILREAAVSVLPIALLMAIVLGSIYRGVATATEAGAIGALGAFLIALGYRQMSLTNFVQALRATVTVTCMILIIVVGAAIYSYAIVSTGISRGIVDEVVAMQLSPYVLLAVIAVIFLILGMFIDGISIIFLTLPLLLPVVIDSGVDMIVFGVLTVMLVEIGQVTPPLGINNVVVQSLDPTSRLSEVVKGSMPFAGITLALAVVIVFVPGIATALIN